MSEGLITSGPMFEPKRHNGFMKVESHYTDGSHYSVWYIDAGEEARPDSEVGMESLRSIFPEGKADDLNFVLFSTSGVHGSYITIEEIEAGLHKYGDDFDPGEDEWPEGWHGTDLTVLIVQPRTVCLRCGNIRVRRKDIAYLKRLRRSSMKAVESIGAAV